MKATMTSLECAKSAKDTLLRVQKAIEDATKRLAQLNQEEKQPRITAAIEQIQIALKTADSVHQVARRVALAACALDPRAQVELDTTELAALSYGLDKP